jgi:hypothetical protein
MRFVFLGDNGECAIVDDRDYRAIINAGPWRLKRDGTNKYAQHHIYVGGKRTTQTMHRFLVGETIVRVDHKNLNGLDNRRDNFREATAQQNGANSRSRKGSSEYKGVSWYRWKSKWQAQIQVNHKTHNLGYFKNERDAAAAYDVAAKMYFGDFANTNGIGDAA